MVAIDDLGLRNCDLIQLDVEGYELPALKGASDTIKRCRPLVVIEVKDHGKRFGYSKEDLRGWLAARSYRRVATILRDEVWKSVFAG